MAVYKADILDIELNTGNIARSFLCHNIGKDDTKADRFGVRVYRDGEPESLSGCSIQGYMMRPNGTNLAITGSNTGVSGNEAWVDLPQAAYDYEGQFCLALKLIGGGVTGTIRIIDGMINNTFVDDALVPMQSVPTYQEILAVYDQMVAAKNGSVRFDQSQSLTETQKSVARMNIDAARDSDVSDLKSATVQNRINFLAFEQGGINTAGTKTVSATRVRTATKITAPMHVETLNVQIMIMAYVVYNATTDAFVSYNALTNATSVDLSPDSGTYILLTFKYRNDAEISPADLQPDLTITKLSELLKNAEENIAEIEQDISEIGVDISEIGVDIAEVKTALTNQLYFLELEQGAINVTTGARTDSTKIVRTVTKIKDPMHIETLNDDILVTGIYTFNDDGSFDSYTATTNTNKVDVNPASGKFVWLTFRNRDNNANTTPNELQPMLTITKLIQCGNDVVKNREALLRKTDETNQYIIGKLIDNSKSVGVVVDITPTTNASLACFVTECTRGDKFKITGIGGQTGRLWGFLDTNKRQISAAASNASATSLELTATEDGFFVSNVLIASTYSLEITRRVSVGELAEQVDKNTNDIAGMEGYYHLTNPHYLRWRMGVFTASGPQGYTGGMLPTDRFFTIVKVKAGSKVSKKSGYTHRKRIFFGYKLSESDATLTGYTYDAGDIVTIDQDCIAYIGVLYENPVVTLLDDTILDELEFDLDVIDYKSRYSNPDSVSLPYGNPCPEIYYEGQHADATGWNLYTSDIDAIHDAFDTLCTASDGYLSKVRDYGVVYTGNADNTEYSDESEWHIYEYMTRPCPPNLTPVPKIAITCGIHGNEKMSVYAMHYLMYDLIYNSTKNPVLSYLKNNCIITFLPMCNPYGFMKAIPTRLNENGVNLNRNFPTYNWEKWEDTRTDGNGSEPGGQNYKGESAASETETQAVMKFFRNNYDAVLSIDLHTNGANTASRDQISAYMPTEPQDITDANYQILHDFLVPGKIFTTRLKPWLNEKYDAGMDYTMFWGVVAAMDYYPSCSHWVRETAGEVGQCYEVMAGSSTQFIGNQLTQYAPATIKAAAEELGNFLVTMLAHIKNVK